MKFLSKPDFTFLGNAAPLIAGAALGGGAVLAGASLAVLKNRNQQRQRGHYSRPVTVSRPPPQQVNSKNNSGVLR